MAGKLRGGEENCADSDYTELLLEAIEEGNLWKVKRAFDLVPPEELPDVALHIAANGPSVEVLEWLVQREAFDVDAIDDDDGLTALHVAAMYGRQEMVSLLLRNGASPAIVDREGCTPVDHSHRYNFPSCVKVFEDACSKEESKLRESECLDVSRAVAYVSMAEEEERQGNEDEAETKYFDALEDGWSSQKSLSLSEELQCMTADALRQRLVDFGEKPGPIMPYNKHLYLKYLAKITSGQITSSHRQEAANEKGHQYEMSLCLAGHVSIPKLYPMEVELATSCQISGKKGLCSCFVYCLLDPIISENLPAKEDERLNDLSCFKTFVSSVFYIGKGTNNRPLQHLLEANKSWIVRHRRKCAPSTKAGRIHSVWAAGRGVVSVHCFHNVSEEEAHSMEACMIDAFGLANLTNQKRGVCYNVSRRWAPAERRRFGVYLLYRAMKVYMAEGEREISPADLVQKERKSKRK